jgi:hypothetical protein
MIVKRIEKFTDDVPMNYVFFRKLAAELAKKHDSFDDLVEDPKECREGKILNSPFFCVQDPQESDESLSKQMYIKGAVNISKLLLMVILQCHNADDMDVAECFYDIANPGFFDELKQDKPEISAGQKELGEAFKFMCTLVSKEMIGFYAKFDDEGKDKYDESDYERLEEAIEELKDDWIDMLFESECELKFESFVQRMCQKEVNWIFNSQRLRKKLFAKAEIKWKYA